MKRILLLLICAVFLFSGAACGTKRGSLSEKEMTNALNAFVSSMSNYDIEEMTSELTEFPNKDPYVYLDDIFNDEAYTALYRAVYYNISHKVKRAEADQLVVEFTMPDIRQLYITISSAVLNMALNDPDLQQKLNEDEMNGVILIQQAMLSAAAKGNYDTMKQEFTLSFKKENDSVLIVCDDELRALLTGNLFLSRNMKKDDIAVS